MDVQSILKFERSFDNTFNKHPPPLNKSHQEAIDRADAILSYVSKKIDVPVLTLDPWQCTWIMSCKDQSVRIHEEMAIDITVTEYTKHEQVAKVSFQISSNKINTGRLKQWSEELYDEYIDMRESHFTGSQLFLFEAKSLETASKGGASLQLSLDGRSNDGPSPETLRYERRKQDVRNAQNKPLEFIKRPFSTNKSFDNLFGPSVTRVRDHLRRFQTQEVEYDRRGLPYRFGALISGKPGCGKTSIIQAIAAETRRHIVTVNFANVVTTDRLTDLFYSDYIHVADDAHGTQPGVSVRIPLNRRLYVLEDIDALDTVVLQRDETHHGFNQNDGIGSISNEITLSDILNVFDGTLQNSGRVMIVTTNHPEKLDAALIRAGRFDCKCDFNLSDPATLIAAFKFFFQHVSEGGREMTNALQILQNLHETFRISMADAHCIFFQFFDDPEGAAASIRDTQQEEKQNTTRKRQRR